MKTGMDIPDRWKIKIDNVDGDHIWQFAVVLSRFQAVRVLFAPIEQTPLVHVLLVTQLHLDICPCAVLQYRTDIEDTGLIAYHFTREGLVFKNLHGVEPFSSGSVKYRIDEAQQLDLVAFFSHYFEKKEII
jgi:hypothetical protein